MRPTLPAPCQRAWSRNHGRFARKVKGTTMTKRTSTFARGARLAVLAVAVLPAIAHAASLGTQCRRACRDEIAACVEAGGIRSDCRVQIVGACKQQGLEACGGSRKVVAAAPSSLNPPSGLTATAQSQSTIAL